MCNAGVHRGKKRVSDPLKLKLQEVITNMTWLLTDIAGGCEPFDMSAGNRTPPFFKYSD